VWPKIIIGCVGFLVLLIIGIVVLFNIGTNKLATAVTENAKNPALRAENAKKMLGASRLPDGYYPVSGTFNLPLVTNVRLYDRPPDANGYVTRFDKRGFIYVQSLYTDSSKKLEEFFAGAPGASLTVQDIGVKYRAKETVRSGSMDIGNQKIRYRFVRGRVEEGESEAEGPMVVMWIDCPGEKKERYAAWFGPEDTIGEEASIRAFMSQFDLCRAK
jgi:hypothetical protein